MVDGCPRTGAPVVWPTMPIPYRFGGRPPTHLNSDEARGAIRLAFERWTQTVCPDGRRTSLRFHEGPDMPPSQARGKEPFGLYFRDDGWPHDDQNDTLALTTQFFAARTGEIQYSDIEINTAQYQFALRDNDTGKDLEAVITHEVGHYIGFAHSPDPDSIMTAKYHDSRGGGSKELLRDLGDDDVLAVCALYPPNGTEAIRDPASSGGCAVTRPARERSGVPLVIVALAGAMLVAARGVARSGTIANRRERGD